MVSPSKVYLGDNRPITLAHTGPASILCMHAVNLKCSACSTRVRLDSPTADADIAKSLWILLKHWCVSRSLQGTQRKLAQSADVVCLGTVEVASHNHTVSNHIHLYNTVTHLHETSHRLFSLPCKGRAPG
jgi:hypothetical protein